MFDMRAFWTQSLINNAVYNPSKAEEISGMAAKLLDKGLITDEDVQQIESAVELIIAARNNADSAPENYVDGVPEE